VPLAFHPFVRLLSPVDFCVSSLILSPQKFPKFPTFGERVTFNKGRTAPWSSWCQAAIHSVDSSGEKNQQEAFVKRTILGIIAAFLLTACLTTVHEPDGMAQNQAPSRLQAREAVAANRAKSTTDQPFRVPKLNLPATFTGDLPCADCEGIRYHLDLWSDGVFHLRRLWLGTPGVEDDRGRWRWDPSRPVLFLYGGRDMPFQFEVTGPNTIRKLDLRGRPIESELNYTLTSDGTLTPTDLSLFLHGMFRYMADAARFEECLTGRSYPVAMEGDYIKLERAYLEADKPEAGAPLMASFEGHISLKPAMEGDKRIPTVSVRRFIDLWPGQHCKRAMSEASLPNQYWKLVSLGGEPLEVVESRREPHLVLRNQEKRYSATAGCNWMIGGYKVEGDTIEFSAGPSTRMACPPPLRDMEEKLLRVLREAKFWSINGQVLELLDEGRAAIATFEAVYLP
jgi:heat shock protein HslJ/uncharacterized lipoprotein NlpE involved in copper resistance